MIDRVMSTKSLPEIIFRLIPTEKVLVREVDGSIQITPSGKQPTAQSGCAGFSLISLKWR